MALGIDDTEILVDMGLDELIQYKHILLNTHYHPVSHASSKGTKSA